MQRRTISAISGGGSTGCLISLIRHLTHLTHAPALRISIRATGGKLRHFCAREGPPDQNVCCMCSGALTVQRQLQLPVLVYKYMAKVKTEQWFSFPLSRRSESYICPRPFSIHCVWARMCAEPPTRIARQSPLDVSKWGACAAAAQCPAPWAVVRGACGRRSSAQEASTPDSSLAVPRGPSRGAHRPHAR